MGIESKRYDNPEVFGEDPNKFERILIYQAIESFTDKIRQKEGVSETDLKEALQAFDQLGKIGYFKTEIDWNQPQGAPDEEDLKKRGIDPIEQHVADMELVNICRSKIKLFLVALKYARNIPPSFVDQLYVSIAEHMEPRKHGAAIMMEYLSESRIFPHSDEARKHVMQRGFIWSSDSVVYMDFLSAINKDKPRKEDKIPGLSPEEMRELLPKMKETGVDTARAEEWIAHVEQIRKG